VTNSEIDFNYIMLRSSFVYSVAHMDILKAVETYVNKLVSTPSAMKVLLLDSHTVCLKAI